MRYGREGGLAGACPEAKFRAHADKPDEAGLPDMVARGSDGRAPRTHIVTDLSCVRVGSKRDCVCLLAGLRSRETVGHAAGGREGAGPAKPAFAMPAFPPADIQAFHADRGSEPDGTAIGGPLGASGNERSLPRKGRPYDNSAGGATNETLKAEPVYGESFPTLHELQVRPNDYVRRYSHFSLRSRLGYVSPV